MLKIATLISLLFLSFLSVAGTSLYESLSTLPTLGDSFEIIKAPNGIDIKSKQKFENSKGKIEPITHMELEGPFKNDRFQTLEHGIQFLGQLVQPEVDEKYQTENMVYPGLGVAVVDVNGINVGLLDYKMNREPDTYVRRAVLLSDNGLYSYTIVMHKSEPKDKVGMQLMGLVIASVNSGKL